MGRGPSYLGEFEHVVLLALARREGAADGAAIHGEVLETTGRHVSIPAVQATLERLEKKGLVTSRGREGREEEQGSHPPGRYRILPEGEEALARTRALLGRLWDGVDLQGPETGS